MSDLLSPAERLALIKSLNSLMQSDFDSLLFYLNVPNGAIPPDASTQGNRVGALLQWVQGPTGCGLEEFIQALDNVFPGAFKRIPQTLNTHEPISQTERLLSILPSQNLQQSQPNRFDSENVFRQESTAKVHVEQALKQAREDLALKGRRWKTQQARQIGWYMIAASPITFILGRLTYSSSLVWFSLILIMSGIAIHIVTRLRTMSVTQQIQAEAYLKEVEHLLYENRILEAASKMDQYKPSKRS